MVSGHRYILEKYKGVSSRYSCPGCGCKREFARYIGTQTGAHLGDHVGICNRLNSCGYHYAPKQFFAEQGETLPAGRQVPNSKVQTLPTGRQVPKSKASVFTIDFDVFKGSFETPGYNAFIQYLHTLFDATTVRKLTDRYYIGSSGHWAGATVFWQIDVQNNVRAGKVMLYNGDTGKRVKQPYNHITWMHTLTKQSGYELKQCLFGEHLLHGNRQPVAIVESEKTAIIASVYLPQYVWLACGGAHGINAEKFGVLKGREVILFPDLSELGEWRKKAKELSNMYRLKISTFLDIKHSGEEQGIDIADYLIKTKGRYYDEWFLQLAYEFCSISKQFANKVFGRERYLKITKDIEMKIRNAGKYSMHDFANLTSGM